MNLYWTRKCQDNQYRCPNCQNTIGTKYGQMPVSSKNHKIQLLDGQVKCVVCDTTVGYFPQKSIVLGDRIKWGMSTKVLNSVEFVSPINQEDFK